MEAKKIAEVYLKENPNRTEIFVCSDGNAFWTETPARNHANTIKGTYTKFPEKVEETETVEEKPKKKTKK